VVRGITRYRSPIVVQLLIRAFNGKDLFRLHGLSYRLTVACRKSKPSHFDSSKEQVMAQNVKVGLFVRLEAKPGKETEMAQFLAGALPIVNDEPATIHWYAIRLSERTFGIFDVFPDEPGRNAHLNGRVAAALFAKAGELLSKAPAIEKLDVLASK
jgi:quinol monooxygenase YgiN